MFDVSKEDEEVIKEVDDFKFITPNTQKGIKINSKIEAYYNCFLNNIENSININIDLEAETNEFYCPELLIASNASF